MKFKRGILCLLLVKSYLNWLAIVWNHYLVAYFKIIMMVCCTVTYFISDGAFDCNLSVGGKISELSEKEKTETLNS